MMQKKLFHPNMVDLLNDVRRQKQADDSDPEAYRDRVLSAAKRALKKTEQERDRQKEELKKTIDDKISMLKKNFEEQSKSLSEMISSLQEKNEGIIVS